MDHFIEDDLSSMMDSVIPSSELNCMNSVANSVQDTHHETSHDGENHMPEQITFSKTEQLVFDKPLYGSALDPALLTVSSLEDYSDISSCSEADFGHLLNALEKNPDQSSELPDAGNSRDKNELEMEAASDHATEKQEDVCRASETEVEGRSGSLDNVIDGDDREKRNLLNIEFQCSDPKTTEGENGCPLKTEEGGFLFQTSNCGVTESSEICKDTTQISSVCALDINGAHPSTEDGKENTNSNENIGVQNDCHLKRNTTCEAKNNTPEYKFKHDVKNTAHGNEPEYNRTKNSEEVEHSSFEFLQSCFGFTSLGSTKSDPNAANVLPSENMTQDSQNCEVNHSQPPVLVSATLESVTGAQIKEASDNGLLEPTIQRTCRSTSVSQDPGQQSEPLEDQFIKRLARTESTHDTGIIISASLLSSKKFMRKLQPVVLVKTTKHNAKDGKMYICSVCQKNWQDLDELIEHHHCEHFEHAIQYCLTCGAYISTGTLAEHLCKQKDMQLSTVLSSTKQLTEKLNAKYLCKYCEKPFIKVSYHQDHEQRHRTVTQHRCNCCGLYFSNAKKLLTHKQKVKCSPLILEPNKQRKVSEKVPKDQTKPTFTIHDCFVKLVDINKDRPSPQKIDCSICGKSFKLRAQLKAHLRSHTSANPFKCTKCKKVFKYSWNLDKHLKELCSGNATKQHITDPSIRGRFISGFACPICPRIFRYSYNRTRHMRQQCLKEYMRKGKGKVGNRYKCPMCDETFSMSCNRNRHIKNRCFEQYKLLRIKCKMTLVKENIKEEKEEKQVLPTENLSSFKCKVCSASFAHKSGVYRHMKKHSLLQRSTAQVGKHDSPTNVKEPDSNNEAPQNQECSSPNSSDMVNSPPILCSFCDKSFISSESLKNHLQLHVGKKPFRCLECGKSFIRRGHLITHKNIHKRRIQCSVCKKIVPTIADLLKHRQSHITKGMLQCPDCPKQFKFPVYLLRHVAIHAKKERMLKSPTKKSADEHVKEIGSNKEPFICGICQKAFVDSEAISEHCLSHLPKPSVSKCPVCKHNFTSRATLIRHFRLHTGEKPFPCKICGKHFKRKEPLALHAVKCKGPKEKPISTLTTDQTQQKCEVTAVSKSGKVPKQFRCSHCPHIFARSSYLKMHENAHLANNLVSCFKCGKYYKKNKIYGHRKRCTAKESSPGEAFKSEQSGNAHESKCTNLVVTNRTCRIPKDIGTNNKDRLKERCPHCSKRFQYRSVLLRHLHTHLGKQQFACTHCNQKYSNKSSCQQHEALCDGVLRQHESKCLNESEETKHIPDLQSASSLKECTVIIGKNGEELKCNFCTKTFTKARNLRRHILTHTEVKPYRCKTCENCFSRYDHLKYHQNRCRGKKQQLDVNLEQKAHHAGSQAKKQTQSDVFECSSCSKTFSSHTNLIRHFSMLHSTFKPFSCKRCDSGFSSQDSLKRHSDRGNCRMFSAECGEQGRMPTASNTQVQSCRETSKLMQRIEGHFSNKWKFPCEYCPRRFKTQTQLKMHTRLHTGEKPFGCASCDERFIRRDYLKRHLTKCSGKRQGPKVLCDKCGGLFTQEALEQHQKNCIISLKSTDCPVNVSSISSHSKVKAFSCVSCNEHFLLFSQLQQHILTKHISDGLQPSGIPEYETLSSNLPIKEEPVDDDDCAENLQDSSQIYANSGSENTACAREKPFECEQCNMRFINNGGLGMHMRIHTTIYPLSCQKCNKGFWSKNVQQKHMRKCKGLKDSRNESSTIDAVSSELECTPNDEVLVFNEGSNTTGTGVLQTKFSCKDQDKGNADKEDAVVHKYQCSECEQSFTDGLMLISHLEAHGREDQERRLGKSHRCHICGKIFDHAGMLQRHVKTQHQETVKNTCPECFKSFRYPSDLDIHRSCHDPNRPFVCETCDLRFWTSKSLSTHQRLTHSASEPLKTVKPIMKPEGLSSKLFTCYPCNKVYTIRRSYMKHCRAKHKGRSESLGDVKNATTEPQLNNESDGSDADDKDFSNDDSDSAPYFPCHVCGKTFLTSEGLEDHQRCHLGEKPYECEECGKCFIQLVNLQQHQRSHKSEFQCQMCGKGFVSLFALRKHKHTHVRKHPHRCTKCSLSFTRSSQLTEHMIMHREENFPCDLCHKNFSCKSSRAEHRKIHTEADEELPPLIPPAKQISPPVSISPSLSTVQQYKYCCEICHVQFPDPEQLSEHGCSPAKERPYSCKDCNKHFLHGSHLKKHQLTHQLSGTRSFQCNSCHMSFSHRHHFLTHLQIHGGEEPSKSQVDKVKILNTDDSNQNKIYRCPICPESFSQVLELANHLSVHANMCNVCNKTFSTKQQLEKHEQSHLSAATQYECTECGKSFLGSDAFRQHYCVHQKHLSCSSLSTTDGKRCVENSFDALTNNEEEEEVDVGEDFYNCPTCNKRFPSNTALKEHQKLHTFDRPFKCLVCGKSFAKKKYLTQHQQKHNEQPYQCDLCTTSFKTEQSLLSHRKTHDADRNYRCSICDKSYRTPYDLSRHEQKHPELQKFTKVSGDHRCDMCYKSFSLLSQLRQHQETHVGQVVYECTECDKAFAFLHLLEEHQQTHGTSTDTFQSQSPSEILFQSPVIE